ncbi:MAG: metal-dependent hydrolase [Turicibacter sp.]
MTAATHQRGGLLCGLLTHHLFIGSFYEHANLFSKLFLITLFCTAAVVGSLLPDIDMRSSHISKLLPFISRLMTKRFKHRTATHSLLSIFLFILIASLSPLLNVGNEMFIIIILGLMIGHTSHIMLDLFTHQGVSLFYPYKKKFKLANFKTGAGGEKVISALILMSTCFYFLYETYSVIAFAIGNKL